MLSEFNVSSVEFGLSFFIKPIERFLSSHVICSHWVSHDALLSRCHAFNIKKPTCWCLMLLSVGGNAEESLTIPWESRPGCIQMGSGDSLIWRITLGVISPRSLALFTVFLYAPISNVVAHKTRSKPFCACVEKKEAGVRWFTVPRLQGL